MRKRYRYNAETKQLVEVPWVRSEPIGPVIWDDLPAYESPIDGRPVDGRKQRRNDLARSNCRPYEGREQESKQATRIREGINRQSEEAVNASAHRAWAEAPERLRKVFRSK